MRKLAGAPSTKAQPAFFTSHSTPETCFQRLSLRWASLMTISEKGTIEGEEVMGNPDLIGSSPRFRAVLGEIELVAPAECAVLVRGETGTGRELVAQAIHEASPRRRNRFVALNCAAIPAALLESELFGHERGAFTGAVTQTAGR